MTADRRKLLVLDLDETLVYATAMPLDREADFRAFDYHVYRRPHVDRFVRSCFERFRVAVWTTSGSEYAAIVVANVFPDPGALEFVWSNERCSSRFDPELRERYSTKPLTKVRRLGHRLERVIAVDDTPKKYAQSYGNLVTVREWGGDLDDDELLRLERYLALLDREPDVRAVEKRHWRSLVDAAVARPVDPSDSRGP